MKSESRVREEGGGVDEKRREFAWVVLCGSQEEDEYKKNIRI